MFRKWKKLLKPNLNIGYGRTGAGNTKDLKILNCTRDS